MKFPKLIAAIGLVIISAGLFSLFGNAQQGNPSFNDAQKEEINTLIRNYILENPEIIPEAVNVLRKRQNASMLLDAHDQLYNDGYSYVAGNKDGDVTLIEFYDYNCGYCKQVPSILSKLLDEDKNLKIIYKELPILAESSNYASAAAMAAIKQGKFMEFHNAMMKNKRSLTKDLVIKIARDAGLDEEKLKEDMKDPEIVSNITKTKYLVQNIGISGTPGFVIGDQIIAGYVPYEHLKEVIDKVRETQKM
ncbi:MAG: DsbA family protein [Kordiimonadaceae bacterium]|nr:DsbA family protein [Kordiimonadaceae bacterium]